MKKKCLICFILPMILLIALPLTACDDGRTQPTTEASIYNFEEYENVDIFDIKKVELSEELAEKCCSYKFTYLSDGLKIKGYISIPNTAIEANVPWKCVVYNRGGNRDYGRLENDTTAMACSFCDRIVIASQYRGAGGSEGSDQLGGDDLHDVIKLIDFCEDYFPFVDMDDFAVMGASRGGMMTYMTARSDSRVKRIIAVSAVSDMFESYEAREDMRRVSLETIGCTATDNPEEYEKRSAVYWYDELKIPVLIIHSKKDEQVHFSQAEELYSKLKDATECSFITYEDDVHGIHPEDRQIIYDWLHKE